MTHHIPCDPDDGDTPDPTMDWLERLGLGIRSRITQLNERIANPERLLHQMMIDLEDELESVRHSIARAVAAETQLRREWQAARETIAEREQQARQALATGDEELALSLLEAKAAAQDRAGALDSEHRAYHLEVAALQAAYQVLEDTVRQTRQKRNVLVARLARAEADRRVRTALNQIEGRSAAARFRRLEDKVARAEAFSVEPHHAPGCHAGTPEQKKRLQQELERLKRRLEDAS